jgi:hypothetical protein
VDTWHWWLWLYENFIPKVTKTVIGTAINTYIVCTLSLPRSCRQLSYIHVKRKEKKKDQPNRFELGMDYTITKSIRLGC